VAVPAQKVTNEKGAIVIKTRFAAIFLAMTLGICSMPQASDAQQPRKIPRVVFFGDCTDKTATVWQAFENGLREGGYNIGQNIAVDCRSFSPERDDLVREIARNLVRENVDVIVTPGTQVTLAVKQETNSIPIVMVAVGDPVGVGLVASLARPGGNITGLSNMMPDVAGKRLEMRLLQTRRALRSCSIRQMPAMYSTSRQPKLLQGRWA